MKPIIAINLDIEQGPRETARIESTYFTCVRKAGGIPVAVPPMSQEDLSVLFAHVDGLMLIGGNDYAPALYGETPSAQVKLVSPVRQEFDLCLVKYALEKSTMPILGICGGLQLLNISLGGSLIQDLPSQMPGSTVCHDKPDQQTEGWQKHSVEITPGSRLANIYSCHSLAVTSSHHQAIKEPGHGLAVTARAADGVIEAVELADSPFIIAVQWHPERDWPTNQPLFSQFIQSCTVALGVAR